MMVIIGHRGAKGYEPENTLASFQKAISLGVDMIELDVYAVKTGEIVVMHDPTVERTTNGTGKLSTYTFEKLRLLDAGRGQTVPLLSEVLDLVDRRLPVNIELKGAGSSRGVAKIIRHYILHKSWNKDLFVVSSFDLAELRKFSKLLPQIPISHLFDHLPASYWKVAARQTFASAHIGVRDVTRQNVRDAHKNGVKLYAYTVNTKREALRLRKLFVDGIFSDYPDRVRSFSARPTRNVRRAHS